MALPAPSSGRQADLILGERCGLNPNHCLITSPWVTLPRSAFVNCCRSIPHTRPMGTSGFFKRDFKLPLPPILPLSSKRVVTAEQAAWLVIRATNETRDDLLNLPVLQGEAGLVTLEKFLGGTTKAAIDWHGKNWKPCANAADNSMRRWRRWPMCTPAPNAS